MARLEQFLVTPWSSELKELLAAANRTVTIVSPFIGEEGARLLLDVLQAKRRKRLFTMRVFTALDPMALVSGASSLKALRDLLKENKVRLFVCEPSTGDLHAKLYLADDRRMILTSANLTGPGLHVNLEYGVLVTHRPTIHRAHEWIEGTVRPLSRSLTLECLRDLEERFQEANLIGRFMGLRTIANATAPEHVHYIWDPGPGRYWDGLQAFSRKIEKDRPPKAELKRWFMERGQFPKKGGREDAKLSALFFLQHTGLLAVGEDGRVSLSPEGRGVVRSKDALAEFLARRFARVRDVLQILRSQTQFITAERLGELAGGRDLNAARIWLENLGAVERSPGGKNRTVMQDRYKLTKAGMKLAIEVIAIPTDALFSWGNSPTDRAVVGVPYRQGQ